MRSPLLLLIIFLAACNNLEIDQSQKRENPYILKGSLTCGRTIPDPRAWVRRQFEESCPVTYEVLGGVKRVKLQEAVGDLDHDGKPELFLGNGPARGWMVAVFSQAKGGYKYIGELYGGAFRILPKDKNGWPRVLVFEPCGGHLCFVKMYTHNGKKFECTSSEKLVCGDGAPEENNRKLEELFGFDSGMPQCLKWR